MLGRKWVSLVSLIFLLCVSTLAWGWPFGPSKSRRAALEFDAMVGPAGIGNYTTIEAALAAGKKTIFIKKGTYQPASDLTLSSGVQLIGESRNETIIDFNGQARQIISDGSATTYSTGTISVNTSSTTVTGSGTTWLARTEEYIKLGTEWYEISSIGADDSLTLVRKYFGEALTGQSYLMSDLNLNIVISDLTITGSQDTSGAILFENTNNSVIRDCNISDNLAGSTYQDGLNLLYADHNLIADNVFKNNKCPLELDYCDVNIISNNFLTNNSQAISCFYGTENIIEANEIINNNYNGMQMAGGYRNLIRDNNIKNNTGAGVSMSQAHELSIIGNTISYNDDAGVSYGTNEDFKIHVAGNTIIGNDYQGIELQADHSSVVGNYVVDNAGHGIVLRYRNGCLVSGNVVYSNDEYGIYALRGENHTVTGNVVQENGRHGIYFYGTSHSLISGNTIEGNDEADSATYDGISLKTLEGTPDYYPSYNLISNNRVRDNDRYEICIADVECVGNQIVANSTYGTDHVDEISDSGAGTIILEIEATSVLNQDYSSDGGPTFASLLITGNIIIQGKAGIGDSDPTNGGLVVASGLTIGTDSTNNLIDDSASGSGTTPLYIGNAPIFAAGPSVSHTEVFTGFTSAESKTVNFTGMRSNYPWVIRVQAYISNDPGGDENINCLLLFYSTDAMSADKLLFSFGFNLTYTETDGASATDTTDTVDSSGGLVKRDIIRYLGGTAENVGLEAVPSGTTLSFSALAYDHANDTGVVHVAEQADDFRLEDDDSSKEIHARLTFLSAPTSSTNVTVILKVQ